MHLVDHVEREVGRFAGIGRRPKIKWSSVTLALLIGLPLAYLTYTMNRDGFSVLSLLPGAVAFVMLGGAAGLVISPDDQGDQGGDAT